MRNWKRPSIIAVVFVLSLAALAGCTQRESPTMMSPGSSQFSTATSPYTLAFISRSYNSENNQTTFLYQLQNTGAPTPGPATGVLAVLTDVLVEVPDCAGNPVSYSPPDGANYGVNANGINGVEWGVGYDDNPDLYYSVTFAGNMPAGNVRSQVTRGGFNYVAGLTGPCEGTFTVSGFVFTDTNQDGSKGGSELGVANVSVKLSGGESPEFVKTDSDGAYTFTVSEGSYTVSVDAVTADTDYNESLYRDWEPTNAQSKGVTIGPNSTGNDFGWEPNVDGIVARIDSGDLPTTGQSYKWWRKEFLRVINHQHNTAYTEAQLLGLIGTIEGYALLDEYNFTPGHELQEVYDILNNHAFEEDNDGSSVTVSAKLGDQGRHDEWQLLLRELLTFELNHVSGRGPADTQLRTVLINWGEGVLKDNAPSSDEFMRIGDGPQRALESPLEGGTTIFKKANGATGGGGTGN